MTVTEQALLETIQGLEIIDAHEHLPEEETLPSPDFLRSSLSYLITDLVGAGFQWDNFSYINDTTIPIRERWKVLAPFWEEARYTGYGQCVERSMAELYGVDRIDNSTVSELNQKFQEANQPGHYRHVLKERLRIQVSVNDMIGDMKFSSNPLFSFVARVDDMVEPSRREEILRFGERTGREIRSLSDYESACIGYLDRLTAQGHIGLKCGMAYRRSLFFGEVPRKTANELFSAFLETDAQPDPSARRAFQDYMMHFVLRAANERRMLLQIHTGLLAGQGLLDNSNPLHLNSLFMKYQDIRFDVFHMGYPFCGEIGTLTKMFPHVYLNMCWTHIISPVTSVRMLEEWLACLPTNKIIAFGGDSSSVDNVVGHLRVAQENVARALARQVENGLFTLSAAREIAGKLFYRNPAALYHS